MKRRLIVMRHAKSSWDNDVPTDHLRPLNKRGRRDAPRVAERLAELEWVPQYILSSDAQRTRETCQLLLGVWDDGIEAEFLQSLYHAGVNGLQHELPRVSEEVETLMVIGHNPGWEEVVCRLSGQSVVMKTGTAALLESECDDWSDAINAEWELMQLIYPREL